MWEGDLAAVSAILPPQLAAAAAEGVPGGGGARQVARRDLANLSFDESSQFRVSLLYIAAQQGHATVVRRLLDHGADCAVATAQNATPLFVACKAGPSLDELAARFPQVCSFLTAAAAVDTAVIPAARQRRPAFVN